MFKRRLKRRLSLFEGAARKVGFLRVVRADIENRVIGNYRLNALPLVLFEPGLAVLGGQGNRLSAVAEVQYVVAAAELLLKLCGIAVSVFVGKSRALRYRRAYARDDGDVFNVLFRNGFKL